MNRAELETKTAELERRVAELDSFETNKITALVRLKAQILALESLLRELAEQQGVPRSEFAGHVTERSNHFLDLLLAEQVGVNPAINARLDDRDLDEVPTQKHYRPLFPPHE